MTLSRFRQLAALSLLLPRVAASQEADDTLMYREENAPQLIGGIQALQRRLVYPDAERRAGVEVRAIVMMVTESTGVPHNVRVVRSVSPALDAAAVAALREARFVPCVRNWRPTACRMTLPVTFRAHARRRARENM